MHGEAPGAWAETGKAESCRVWEVGCGLRAGLNIPPENEASNIPHGGLEEGRSAREIFSEYTIRRQKAW